MSIYELIFSAFVIIAIVMIIALRPNSKECELDTKYDYEGFKVKFKTSEKSTPSDKI